MPLGRKAGWRKGGLHGPAIPGADTRCARPGSDHRPLDCESSDASVECRAYVCEHEDQRDPKTKTSHQIPLWVGAV